MPERRHLTQGPLGGLLLLLGWALTLTGGYLVGSVYSTGFISSEWLIGALGGFVLGVTTDRILHQLPRFGLLERRHEP